MIASAGALRRIRGRTLLAGVSALACWLPGVASAATYLVSNETELTAAVNAANADGDPSSSIVMTQSFNVTAPNNLPTPTKSLSIDTQGFTLSGTGVGLNPGNIRFSGGTLTSGTVTLSGTIAGADRVGTTAPGVGLVFDSGVTTIGGTTAQIVNNGSITGGSTTATNGSGGLGVSLLNVVTFVNNGTVTGGTGQGGGLGNNMSGVNILNSGATVINNASGIIQGGNSGAGGFVGSGVFLTGTAAKPATLVNYGTIRGGSDLTGVGTGGFAVRSRGVGISITNYGTLEGGNGAAAIGRDTNSVWNVTVVNSGTIRAGAGSTTAILFANNAGSKSTLELQAGSQIIGNVLAGDVSTNDTLRLGGSIDSSFDVSSIGEAAQYRQFDLFEKTGTSTWTLTGAGTATTNWTISQGTLQIGDGGTSGSIIGDITNNATLAFDRSDISTFAGTISGTGAVNQVGTGTTILTGANTYSGGTTISAGVLSVSADNNLGDAAGGLTFNGGVLQVTGTSFTGTSRAIDLGPSGGGFDIVDAANSFTVSQALTGGGPLSKLGAGTLILTGDNSYSGGTTISAGTLQLGNSGTTGSISGNVVNNGTLAFDRSNDMTLAGAISGSGAVVQQGSGSTTLSGANSYSGGTTIAAGRLIGQASSFGTGDILDNAVLVFDQPVDAIFAAAINGSGSLIKTGLGNLNLTSDSTLNGATTIQAGKLSVNGSLASSTVTVLGGGALGGNGMVGATTLQAGGVIAPGNSIGTLTVNGNYVGAGGTLEIEAMLDGDTSPADKLVITGNTSGTTNVRVIALGGSGAQTTDGIKIVDVGGTSAGTFNLQGDYVYEGDQAVVAGAYAYRLYQNGISTPADGDWYLRSALIDPVDPGGPTSPLYAPSVPIYEAYAGVLQSFNQLGTLQQRIGNRSWAPQSGAGGGVESGNPIWGRIEAAHSEFDPGTSTTGTDYDADLWKLQAGLDVLLSETAAGVVIGGVTVHYGTVKSDVSSAFGAGSIEATGYGVGGTLTWYGKSGLYIDTQAQLTWFDSDLDSATLGRRLTDGNNGFGYSLGIEAGRKIALRGNWSLTPQAQLSYASVDYDTFTDPYGAVVSNSGSDSLVGRLGLSADYDSEWKDRAGQSSRSHVYGIANLYYDVLDGSDVDVSATRLTTETQALWGGIGLGGSLSWADDRYAVHGELLARSSLEDFGDSYAVGGSVGFKVKW